MRGSGISTGLLQQMGDAGVGTVVLLTSGC